MMSSAQLPRHVAVLVLVILACSFAGNHVAARIAFDHDAGLLVAILFRSGVAMVALFCLVIWRRESLRFQPQAWGWQLLMGLLIAIQSFCIYSAVARIPIALALLVVNLAPIMLALLTWALGGARPSGAASLLMLFILFGLALALDLPSRLSDSGEIDIKFIEGLLFGITAAAVFACALWITDHRLGSMPGLVRSLLTIMVVFISTAVVGSSGLIPNGMSLPTASAGWVALVSLAILYGAAFSVLFTLVTRLDIARNAPVMNVEPVAGLIFGWLILDQVLGGIQIAGGLIVVSGIVMLAYTKIPGKQLSRPPCESNAAKRGNICAADSQA
ncbi:EamA family transporter [Marinobacter sp. ANT_B65]|uniref:EamA family transporter n=1 Tax=Marinobacter sp. ANT_B65 TaxID=2039467 RepID=UPI000BBF27F9|nr:DMT family transporter [Marinobacter sp. ANT_B65]PCM45966.1 EamA family transporter [Marinobacter sp. ANT_B65]